LRKLQFFFIICTLRQNFKGDEKAWYTRIWIGDVRKWCRVLFEALGGRGIFEELYVDVKKIKWIFKKWIFKTYSTDPVYTSM
jgi:hypothetical protein